MARLYVDQNLLDIVQPLIGLDHDVISAGEDDRKGKPDVWHFREAIAGRRTILTLDTDYYYLHGLWVTLVALGITAQPHAGIPTAIQRQAEFSVQDWLPSLQLQLQEPGSLEGQILRWDAKRKAWSVPKVKPWSGMI
jgi:hypothetical protein